MKRSLVLALLGSVIVLSASASLEWRPLDNPAAAQAQRQADPLQDLSDRFEAISRKILPAVVSVEAVKPPRRVASGAKGKATEESGSGVIVKLPGRSDYIVLTNNHVVSEAKAEQITLHLADGRLFKPNRVWADPETDIALLSIEGVANLPTATLGDSDTAVVGRWVLAFGSPFGLNQTVTHGIISARDRGQVSLGDTIRIKEFLQTDAAINPGSSGGPLVDLHGNVIGMNTAIASNNGSNSGVAFSIPINLVKRVMRQMLETGSINRGYLGMQLALSFEPKDALQLGLDRVQGALVERTHPQTPAAAAGLQENDVILQVDNVAVKSGEHLRNLVSNLNAGQRVRLHVWRSRTFVTLEATVGDWNQARARFQQE